MFDISNLSIQELQNLNKAVEARIAELRREDIAKAITQVRELVATYGLTSEDVFAARRGRGPAANPGAKKPVSPKYRDPNTGATWTGRGKAPLWIADKNREEFLIKD